MIGLRELPTKGEKPIGKNLSTPFEGPFSRASSLEEEPLGIHESHTFSPTMGFLTV